MVDYDYIVNCVQHIPILSLYKRDNLSVLKLLQESYLGKIKMIYIDPPYNTGSDLIYMDDFVVDSDEYDASIGLRDDDGLKLYKNTESNGRFHSDW